MPQFRFVHLAPYLADRGNDWFTLQRDDYKPLRYSDVKSHREELANLISKESMTRGSIGDEYSEWKPWDQLPEWAIEAFEKAVSK